MIKEKIQLLTRIQKRLIEEIQLSVKRDFAYDVIQKSKLWEQEERAFQRVVRAVTNEITATSKADTVVTTAVQDYSDIWIEFSEQEKTELTIYIYALDWKGTKEEINLAKRIAVDNFEFVGQCLNKNLNIPTSAWFWIDDFSSIEKSLKEAKERYYQLKEMKNNVQNS